VSRETTALFWPSRVDAAGRGIRPDQTSPEPRSPSCEGLPLDRVHNFRRGIRNPCVIYSLLDTMKLWPGNRYMNRTTYEALGALVDYLRESDHAWTILADELAQVESWMSRTVDELDD
jgi:hypothetical protein